MESRAEHMRRGLKWNGDAIRAELGAALRMAERYQAEQRARIRRDDPRASEDLHDEALGEAYFAQMMRNSSHCDSPEQLREFLSRFKASNVQFHGAFDASVARTAFRQMARQLMKRAESAIG